MVGLLGNRMDAYPTLSFMEALRASVASLHQKVFDDPNPNPTLAVAVALALAPTPYPLPPPLPLTPTQVFDNLINWAAHVGLPSRVVLPLGGERPHTHMSLGSYDVSIWEFQCSEEANAWLCNAQASPSALHLPTPLSLFTRFVIFLSYILLPTIAAPPAAALLPATRRGG